MMQAFRNAAKPLMVVVAFTFFAWLVVDLSGITGSTGVLTKTAVGKYQRWLTSSVAQQYLPSLEAQYREQIQRSKLLRVVTADIYLSDAALWEQYRDEHEMAKVGLTAVISRNIIPDSAVHLSDA